MKRAGALFASLLVVSLLLGAAPAAAGPDSTGQAIAFAHINFDSAVFSSGGKGTHSVSVTKFATGIYDVHFHGLYPRTLTPIPSTANDLIILATAVSSGVVATAGAVSSPFGTPPVPSHTDITVRVTTIDAGVATDHAFFVVVFVGHP